MKSSHLQIITNKGSPTFGIYGKALVADQNFTAYQDETFTL